MVDALLIPLAGIAVPIVIVPVALGLKHARAERELEHVERMKALELGRTLPQDEPWWTPIRLSLAIAVGVPVGAFAGRGVLPLVWDGYEGGIWFAASLVGLGGVLSGSWLASRQLTARQGDERAFAKPHFEDDVFDVAGSRG